MMYDRHDQARLTNLAKERDGNFAHTEGPGRRALAQSWRPPFKLAADKAMVEKL